MDQRNYLLLLFFVQMVGWTDKELITANSKMNEMVCLSFSDRSKIAFQSLNTRKYFPNL